MRRAPDVPRSSSDTSRDESFANLAILVERVAAAWRTALEAEQDLDRAYAQLRAARPHLSKALRVRENDAITIAHRKFADNEPQLHFGGLRGQVLRILRDASPKGIHVTDIYERVLRLKRANGEKVPAWADPLANVEDPCFYFAKMKLPVVLIAPRTWAWRDKIDTPPASRKKDIK